MAAIYAACKLRLWLIKDVTDTQDDTCMGALRKSSETRGRSYNRGKRAMSRWYANGAGHR